MKKKRNLLGRFMQLTWKTSAILGPANRSNPNPSGKHRQPTAEEKRFEELSAKTWQVKTTSSGEHYAVEIPALKD